MHGPVARLDGSKVDPLNHVPQEARPMILGQEGLQGASTPDDRGPSWHQEAGHDYAGVDPRRRVERRRGVGGGLLGNERARSNSRLMSETSSISAFKRV